jgi:hypothetical protein
MFFGDLENLALRACAEINHILPQALRVKSFKDAKSQRKEAVIDLAPKLGYGNSFKEVLI